MFKVNGFEQSGLRKIIKQREATGAMLYANDVTIQRFFEFTNAEMKRFNKVRIKIDLYPNEVMLPSIFRAPQKKIILSQKKNLPKNPSSQSQIKRSSN